MPDQSLSNFARRHIGISSMELTQMLSTIGVSSLDQLINETVPTGIRMQKDLNLPEALSENDYLSMLEGIAAKNKIFKTYIGQGYYDTITPSVILRNVFQNPGWYTQYTPYQAEIAQGRLEALLNFQTMVSDLTGLPISSASLLDESTAAAEAMTMCEGIRNKKRKNNPATKFFVDQYVYKQTIDVLITRATPHNIEIITGDWKTFDFSDVYIGILIQYPNSEGQIEDYRKLTDQCNEKEIQVVVAADIMSLALLTPPGEWGADVVVGNTQRFGVPMGYGGPHAAFFATKEDNKRIIPGRIIGVSVDTFGNPALRMALQTREQHIRREKATSNICTAQALLAVMASMYTVYHGPEGIRSIASTIHKLTTILAENLKASKNNVINNGYFDTITVLTTPFMVTKIAKAATDAGINFYYPAPDKISISLSEKSSIKDVQSILDLFESVTGIKSDFNTNYNNSNMSGLERTSEILTHPVFSLYHTESKMMRYIKSLENKDLSLVHSMIALGSCTMKLNAASEMIPVTWPAFSCIHPFVPVNQTLGYQQIFKELETYLAEITGFDACSLQPNSGAQGEYAGLLTIKAYHEDRKEPHRNIALIPSSAHGTNPASAVMCGMEVIVVGCDERGNVDMVDLKTKTEQYKDHLAALMITYPSTHGVFETSIKEICNLIHDNGGLVYMDGANMNAQVGLTSPGIIGADVCHLNLHKTFAIPHGGGGPGMGPICVNKKLAPFLPGHAIITTGGEKATHAVSAAPWGSASILLISYGYIRMLGGKGVTDATKYAILNANYIKARLEDHYPILYAGEMGRAAHEMIVDLRQFKAAGVSAEDVAKRLMDYGFHAPTLSFPVAGTIMIEPTESEDKAELDRFCDALLEIRKEIDEVANGTMDVHSNVLTNAPHTAQMVINDVWTYGYSREKAAFPLPYLKTGFKFWPSVSRVDSAHGDRNLICTCPPLESYMNDQEYVK
ncbi:MAG: aminomethyl-transferring glycine dehydrogenase [Saprospiraceae bacterium]|nr:aminomethyl-transferring glycine dehydrogenase [Saprospiraceae bacterium]